MAQKNNSNRLQNSITTIIIVVATIFILFSNMESNLIKTYAQEKSSSSNPSIELTSKLIGNEYRWIGSNNSINPILNITSGVDNQITTKSTQGDPVEHQLIISAVKASSGGGGGDNDKKGKELAKGDEIKGGSSTTVTFNPSDVKTSDYQSLEYYCEYHPDTMKGKVQIK